MTRRKKANSLARAVMDALTEHESAVSYYSANEPEVILLRWRYKGKQMDGRFYLMNIDKCVDRKEIVLAVMAYINDTNLANDAYNLYLMGKKKKIDFVDIAVLIISLLLLTAALAPCFF